MDASCDVSDNLGLLTPNRRILDIADLHFFSF
jgi:hypothetical protein